MRVYVVFCARTFTLTLGLLVSKCGSWFCFHVIFSLEKFIYVSDINIGTAMFDIERKTVKK